MGKFCCAMLGFPDSSQNFLENCFCISSTRLHIIHRFIFIFTGNVYDHMWTGLFTFHFYSTFWKAPKCSHRPPFPQWRAKECPFGLHLSAMHRDPFFFWSLYRKYQQTLLSNTVGHSKKVYHEVNFMPLYGYTVG